MAALNGVRARGFTLFEILIVLALIGIMLGVLAPRLGRSLGVSARTQALRLAALMKAARTEAIMSGRPYMVEPFAHGYRFLRMNQKGRFVTAKASLFRARKLPAGARLQGFKAQSVVFTPSGLVRAFHWTIITSRSRWRLSVNDHGQVVAHAT